MTQALNSVESWQMTVPPESLPEWITVPEAAFLTGTSVDSIQGLVDGRVLPWRPMSSARAAKRVALIRSRDVRDLAHSPAAVVKPAELRQRMVDRLPLGALASIVGAWVLAILATTTGKAAFFHHDRLIMGGTPVAAAIGLFFLSWLVMVGAIVGPSILIAWSRSNGQSVSSNKLPALLGTYISVWMAFGFVASMGDFAVHHLVDRLSWVAARPWLISAGILVTAGAYQLTGFKYWCMRLSLPGDEPLSDGRTSASLRSGARFGVLSIASWGPLMLLALAAGLGNLAWTFALALLMVLETSSSEGWWWCRVSGMGLLVLAGLVAVHPEWAVLLFAAH